MKITIVTVCLNNRETIERCVRSVRTQSYKNYEHIIIDGMSSDGTLEFLKSINDPQILLISEPDDGIYDAMNKGMRLATGDCVGFLHADDFFPDVDTLALLAGCFNESAEIVYGDLKYVNKEEKVVRDWRSRNFDEGLLKFGWMPPHPTLYVSRDLILKIGEYNTAYKISADYDFILRLFKNHAALSMYLNKTLVHMQTGGISNGSFLGIGKKSLEDLQILRKNKIGGVFVLILKNLRKIGQFKGLIF